jgi:hypothetical protein
MVGVVRIVDVRIVEGVVVPPVVVIVVPVPMRGTVLVFVLILVLILVLVVLKTAVVVGHPHAIVGVNGGLRAILRVGRSLRFLSARRRRRIGRLKLGVASCQPQQHHADDEQEAHRPSNLRMMMRSVQVHGAPPENRVRVGM